MDNLHITHLFNYPIKSSKGSLLKTVDVLTTGFKNDRVVAVIDSNNRIITGREYPQLLTIDSEINGNYLTIKKSGIVLSVLNLPDVGNKTSVTLFRQKIYGIPFDKKANKLISEHLNGDYRLVYISENYREIPEKRGGRKGEFTGYSDSAPIHLISLSTLAHLNSKLNSNVSLLNFRPNIVINGCEPYKEDYWSEITINNCTFRVQERTTRCIFTTIDPITQVKNPMLEPLATLSKIRKIKGESHTFGINLIPIISGKISIGDKIKITNSSMN